MNNEFSTQMDRLDENEISGNIKKNVFRRFMSSKSLFVKFLKTIILLVSLLVIVIILPGALQKIVVPISIFQSNIISENDSDEMAPSKITLEKSIGKLESQLNEYVPTSFYMIINSTDNEFMLKKGKEIIRKGKCSTGSYMLLENDKNQKWLFRTPKGQLTVRSKKTDPVWTKPDWAFIEEGLPVPSPNHPSRFEEGVLGDYALVLGDGYMIHGTLWQRYLGLPVTHGCVRLNDADLEVVYKSLNKGSKIYIY